MGLATASHNPRLFRFDFIRHYRFVPITFDRSRDGLGGLSCCRRGHTD
jgi:hypothetical protein